MDEIVTAEQIRQALENTYKTPEWYLGFEVGNSTGSSCRRHADAVAINAYPSKGFETRGFEIKVSKSDLTAELNNGLKSDEIARFCDYWFLVTPKGLSAEFSLPPTWGVIEYHDGVLRQKIKATKLEKTAPTAGFLCAMMRGRERLVATAARRITADREEGIRRETMWRANTAEKDLTKLREKLDEIKKSTGIALDDWTPSQDVIDKLNAVMSLRTITRSIKDIEWTAKALLENAHKIKAAADAMYVAKEIS